MNFVKAVRRILLIKTLVIPTKTAESGVCGLRESGNVLLRCSEKREEMDKNEIKKALECCVNAGNCVVCPLNRADIGAMCIKQNMTNALELINRYEAEIEMLNGSVKSLEELCETKTTLLTDANWSLITAKEKAIKEFAERLEQSLERQYNAYGRLYVLRHIEKLVKEMVGEGW